MELMFAEWEDGERFSFEDSDRFEEDSLCSFISEAESLCQNWRGWRKQSAGPNSPTVRNKDGHVIPLVELSAKQVAFHIPFEVVEKVYPPVPEQLQLRIAYWSFPENEEDIRRPFLSLDLLSLDLRSLDLLSLDLLSLDLRSLDLRSLDLRSLDLLSLDLRSLDLRSLDLLSLDLLSLDLRSLDLSGLWTSIPGPPIPGPPVSGPPVSGPPVSGPPVSGPPVFLPQLLHCYMFHSELLQPKTSAPLGLCPCVLLPHVHAHTNWLVNGSCISAGTIPRTIMDSRLYSCLANGSPDEFQRGEQLYRIRAVKDPLQIGFHLSATVVTNQSGQSKGAYNVAVMFDRCRITSCSCTCGAGAKWCAHVVALCLFRIHNASAVCLRAPVSESLSRLQRDQLQKFAQYLISELPQQILPTAQRLLDELLSSQSTAINTVCGAPDPTAGPSASDQSTWYLDESTLSDNIKKTLHKFCGPSPVVFSDVNSMYLSSTEPPAAAEWACLLRPLRGREPEGIWNLLSIVREMFKRRDSNAAPLLEILTEQCLTYEQIISWWYSVRTSASHSSASGHTGRGNGQSEVAAHACASMCDEMVVLWRLAVLDPTMSPGRRLELAGHLKQWHLKVIEIVKRGQHRKSLDKLFQGFKPAVESCYFNWEVAYPLDGITYCSADKKSSTFCWSRAVQLQRGAKGAAGLMGEGSDSGGAARAEGFSGGDYKGRGGTYASQQEVAVRPKETKRKGLSMSGGGGVLVRLGGTMSLTLEDAGAKCMYKGPSPSFGGKMKLPQGGGKGSSAAGPGGAMALAGAKHSSTKRRTAARTALWSRTWLSSAWTTAPAWLWAPKPVTPSSFSPPPPEMLPSLSPLLRDSHKHGCNASIPRGRRERGSTPAAAEKEADLEEVPAESREEDLDSTSTSTARSSTTEKFAKPASNYEQVPVGSRPEAGPANKSKELQEELQEEAAGAAAGGAAGAAAEEGVEEAVEEEVVGEDDYQAYYVGVASEEGVDRQMADSLHQEEEPDIFAGIKPLEQENRMEVLFACAEALHAHGYSNEACRLAVELARDLLANPPDLKVEQPQTKGKKSKVSTTRQTQVATNTLSKAAFFLTVLSERTELHNLAFNTGMFSLELQRPPASTKALEVKLAYQESEVVALLKKIPLGVVEMSAIRERAEQLRDGSFCDYRPVLPLMLASFIFDVLCTPVVSPTGSRPPSRNRNTEMPGDEELGFEAAVAALGMKTTVSEAEHPLLCEGTRRVKGDLALALMITYKDDQCKLKKVKHSCSLWAPHVGRSAAGGGQWWSTSRISLAEQLANMS
ncbi:Zinc finger SWIM domain-containing protein 8, partial [Takifugu flavidus]